MHRLLVVVMITALFSGCIGEDPIPLDSGEALFDAALDSGDAWDLDRILASEDAYKLEIMDIVSGVQSLVILGEDKDAELTHVAMLTVSGNESIDFEILEGGENFHVRKYCFPIYTPSLVGDDCCAVLMRSWHLQF